MPDWQIVTDAYARLLQVRAVFDSAVNEAVRDRNAGSLPVLELLAHVDSGAVLCSHGDVIPATVEALVRRGMEVQSTVDWRKASVWVLRRKGERITKGKAWAPPS